MAADLRRATILCGINGVDAVAFGGDNVRANRLFIENTGLDSIDDFVLLEPKDLSRMIKDHNEMLSDAAHRPLKIKPMSQKKLEIFMFHCKDMALQENANVDVEDLADDDFWTTMRARISDHDARKEQEHKKLPKFTGVKEYVTWLESVKNTMKSNYESCGFSQFALLKDDNIDVDDIVDPTELREHRFELQGPAFDIMNRKYYLALSACTKDTDAGPFVKQFEATHDGVNAMAAIRAQYESAAVQKLRKEDLEKQLKATLFRGDGSQDFTSYTSTITALYTHLETLEEEYKESEKVDRLLDNIQVGGNVMVAAAITIARVQHQNDFAACCTELNGTITAACPKAKSAAGRRGRQISGASTSVKIRQHDIDCTAHVPPAIWNDLDQSEKKIVWSVKNAIDANKSGRGGGRGGRGRGGRGRGRGRGNYHGGRGNYGRGRGGRGRGYGRGNYHNNGYNGYNNGNNGNNDNGNNNNNDRNVNEATSNGSQNGNESEQQPEKKQKVKPEPAAASGNGNKGGQAGNSFGRGAYRK